MARKNESERKVREFKEFGWKDFLELKLKVETLEEEVDALKDQVINLTNRGGNWSPPL